jgi:tRNA(Met) cytidine acetyltransferase
VKLGTLVERSQAEARRANERRLLVLAGDPGTVDRALARTVDVADARSGETTLVGPRTVPGVECERVDPDDAGKLLGTTRTVLVLDCRTSCDPNVLGRVVGAVDGGGLLILATPPLDAWPDRRDGFDETLAVDPYDRADVAGNFRRRLVDTLRVHPGVSVYDADRGNVETLGLTDPSVANDPDPPVAPADAAFPDAVYRACLTADQVDAVRTMEVLRATPGGETDPGPRAVVVEADRGRGKSSAAGLAAAALAVAGADVVVTAPAFRNAREVLARAREAMAALWVTPESEAEDGSVPHHLVLDGGSVRYRSPEQAVADADADVLMVDEAAAFPVGLLERTLDVDRVVYATTVHGYEGAGRGFSVRFRDRLDGSAHDVSDVGMTDPVRYAVGDPVEVWAFRALALDARPPVDPLIAEATPETVTYRRLDPTALLSDEHLLRETFGLLVLAHYRTEPADLARLLDAPNLHVRALCLDGHVVSVALLAEEGGLPAEARATMYDGQRVRGHMIPDVLMTQLRDEDAGVPRGLRVLRIATHHAARSQGLGSTLLDGVREEFGPSTTGGADRPLDVDYLGVGYGATPELLDFWRANGFRTVHLSVTRNDRSGEHSAVMLAPLTAAGRDLTERHTRFLADRAPAVLSGPAREVAPDVVRAVLASLDVDDDPDLTAREWRLVAAAAGGPGLFSVNPGPFRRVVVSHLVDPVDPDALTGRAERTLVRTVCQGATAETVTEELDFHSARACLRTVGDALGTLVERYDDDAGREELDRHRS